MSDAYPEPEADPDVEPDPEPGARRGRLRRAGRKLVRVGGLLLAIALVLTLIGGLTTRNLLDNLRTHSAELLDGVGSVELTAGDERTLYVTGGLITPGEQVPTPVENITCTVQGPGAAVPVNHLKDEDKKIGIDLALARFQVVGDFRATATGTHEISCTGLGVVVAPEVGAASALARLGALTLGSLGVFAGATLLLLGAILSLLMRRGEDEPDDDDLDDGALPPEQGAEKWWEEGTPRPADEQGPDEQGPDEETAGDLDQEVGDGYEDLDDDGFVELSDEELNALTEEEIAELVASGALIFVDEDEELVHRPDDDGDHQAARSDTYR